MRSHLFAGFVAIAVACSIGCGTAFIPTPGDAGGGSGGGAGGGSGGGTGGGAGGGAGGGSGGGSGGGASSCDVGETLCDHASCKDLNVDPNNCGACDHPCSTGQSCDHGSCNTIDCRTAGVTCATGTYCSLNTGQCLPGCANDNQCASGSHCDLGTHACDCDSGKHRCNGACVVEDANSCGDSCAVCPSPSGGNATCENGQCQQGCTGSTHQCGSACLSNNSVDSCGASCNPCPSGGANSHTTCNGTACSTACDDTFTSCSGNCVDLTSDSQNCGHCGTQCSDITQQCSASSCKFACNGMAPNFVNATALSNQPAQPVAAIGQFLGDANADLVYLDGGTVLFAKGAGDGGFAVAKAGPSFSSAVTDAVTGDVNGDQLTDLVSNTSAGGEPLISQGSGNFATGTAANIGINNQLYLADLNGDGYADLISLDEQDDITFSPGGTEGFSAGGTTTLNTSSVFVDHTIFNAAICDLNGQGQMVVLVSDYYQGTFITNSGAGNQVQMLQAPAADGGSLGAPQVVYYNKNTSTGGALAAADFTGDGLCDIVYDDQGSLLLLVGNGNGTFTKQAAPLTTGTIYDLRPVLFNGPGNAAHLIVQKQTGEIYLFEGGFGGLTQVNQLQQADAGTYIGGIGYVDDDLIPDLILNRQSGTPLLMRGQCQ